jgi:elongation of very long chain fatty acids protein 4
MDLTFLQPIAARTVALLDVPQLADYVSAASEPFAPVYRAFESTLVAVAPGAVSAAREWAASNQSPASADYPLQDPIVIAFWVCVYYGGISALMAISKAGMLPKFELKGFGILHNFFLFALSLYMCVFTAACAVADGYRLANNAAPRSPSTPMVRAVWIFLASKLPEFIDTVIMVLKQNYHQISFLHLYHHSSVLVCTWLYVLVGPGGDAYVPAAMNAGVHVVMYGYYFGTMVSSKDSGLRKFLDSIKFMITKGQMTQFAINLVQAVYLVFFVSDSERLYPRLPLVVLMGYMVSMLLLFGNFLIRNQGKKKRQAAAAAKKLE